MDIFTWLICSLKPSVNCPGIDLGSISSMFYEQLLRMKIPNVQKRLSIHNCLFALLGPMCVKAPRKMLMKLTPGERETKRFSSCLIDGWEERVTLGHRNR